MAPVVPLSLAAIRTAQRRNVAKTASKEENRRRASEAKRAADERKAENDICSFINASLSQSTEFPIRIALAQFKEASARLRVYTSNDIYFAAKKHFPHLEWRQFWLKTNDPRGHDWTVGVWTSGEIGSLQDDEWDDSSSDSSSEDEDDDPFDTSDDDDE